MTNSIICGTPTLLVAPYRSAPDGPLSSSALVHACHSIVSRVAPSLRSHYDWATPFYRLTIHLHPPLCRSSIAVFIVPSIASTFITAVHPCAVLLGECVPDRFAYFSFSGASECVPYGEQLLSRPTTRRWQELHLQRKRRTKESALRMSFSNVTISCGRQSGELVRRAS